MTRTGPTSSASSNRRSSTAWQLRENRQKFTPSGYTVAPRGWDLPGLT